MTMSTLTWEALGVVVVAIWAYMSAVCIRWDRHDESPEKQTWFARICCVFLWWFGMPAMWPDRPPHPWRITDPPLSLAERLRVAEARSLEWEREAGLKFDGIFLKEGYAFSAEGPTEDMIGLGTE